MAFSRQVPVFTDAMRAKITKSREPHVSALGIRLLLWVYRYCGVRCCYALITIVIACAYPFLRSARAASAEFLAQWQLFTNKKSPSVFSHLCTFARTLADRLACRAGFFDASRVRRVSESDQETLSSLYRRGCGVFCITSHVGCFDMLRVLFDCTREDMAGEIHVFMDTAASRAFSSLQLRYGGEKLEAYVHSVETLGPALSMQMVEKLEQGAMVVMAGDRIWRDEDSANYVVPFLGREARFPRGCFRWAAALGVPVYTISLLQNKGAYDMYVKCLSEHGDIKAKSLMLSYVKQLEELCCGYPSNWFNFYHFWK